jgi:hypothetical protein
VFKDKYSIEVTSVIDGKVKRNTAAFLGLKRIDFRAGVDPMFVL